MVYSPAEPSDALPVLTLRPANKTGRFPGPSISSLRFTLRCKLEENFKFFSLSSRYLLG
jgi:hypothetical protein